MSDKLPRVASDCQWVSCAESRKGHTVQYDFIKNVKCVLTNKSLGLPAGCIEYFYVCLGNDILELLHSIEPWFTEFVCL